MSKSPTPARHEDRSPAVTLPRCSRCCLFKCQIRKLVCAECRQLHAILLMILSSLGFPDIRRSPVSGSFRMYIQSTLQTPMTVKVRQLQTHLGAPSEGDHLPLWETKIYGFIVRRTEQKPPSWRVFAPGIDSPLRPSLLVELRRATHHSLAVALSLSLSRPPVGQLPGGYAN